MVKLYIFDLDGTLFSYRLSAQHDAPLDKSTLLPNVRRDLEALVAQGHTLALATNQAPGEFRGRAYTLNTIAQRLDAVAAQLPIPRQMMLVGLPDTPGWKPGPFNLTRLMERAEAGPEQTYFVGDALTDRDAATFAGCRFAWAWHFFRWPNGQKDRSVDWDEWERCEFNIWRRQNGQ